MGMGLRIVQDNGGKGVSIDESRVRDKGEVVMSASEDKGVEKWKEW